MEIHMAEVKDSPDLQHKALTFAEKVFDSIWSANQPQDTWHWIVLILISTIAIGIISIVAFKTISSVLESTVKLIEAYKSSGLPLWLSNDNKSKVRRRKQFSAVLDADLAYLAKAENWNDQYFTDLEAEVEIEGGYYASTWDRMLARRSFGLRKERSLIRAITSSAERALQLVGEPGSGKSVALRHLAKQFAEQGRKSNDKNAIVPLYVNLREVDFTSLEPVTADNIREFVLENIRRGDADTSAFVRENWDDYCHRGIWLFLFDSFDEIPAVLHAEAGSNAIQEYSNAIRQFLEGMGECKGLLASREFKGPEALPWKKLRILPLSGEKQDELINNSFLDQSQMSLVRQHLANSDNSIGATPLFLTLLCRFVRDEHRAPNNDHDILFRHINRLALRDPNYLRKKFSLSTEQLIEGAERLAQLFAEDEAISLAPTLDQIATSLSSEQISGVSIERLVSALVDCKIGRTDVPNASPGDRRFAFAHRRYQEALFVQYLARHPEALSFNELLTEPRWREYTVTLLQTRDKSEISGLLEYARTILEKLATEQVATECTSSPLPRGLAYFNWNNEAAVPLLSLLQEGLARRLHDVPAELSTAVYNFLRPRWEHGDTFDRCEVLRLGGLLPHSDLVDYLAEAFSNGTHTERAHAFKQAAFTSGLPEPARSSVLKMLSDQILLAKDRSELLSLEALAARLPESIGANLVVIKSSRIRRHLNLINKFRAVGRVLFPLDTLDRITQMIKSSKFSAYELFKPRQHSLPQPLELTHPLVLLIALWTASAGVLIKEQSNLLWLIFSALGTIFSLYLLILCQFLTRSRGKELSARDIITWINCHHRELIAVALTLVIMPTIFIAVAWALGSLASLLPGSLLETLLTCSDPPSIWQKIKLGAVIEFVTVEALAITIITKSFNKSRKRRKKWKTHLSSLKKSTLTQIEILCSAGCIEELSEWLQNDKSLLNDETLTREFSSFTLNGMRLALASPEAYPTLPSCLKSDDYAPLKFIKLRQKLEDRIAPPDKPGSVPPLKGKRPKS